MATKPLNLKPEKQVILDKIIELGIATNQPASHVQAAVLFGRAESNFNPSAVGPTPGTTIRGLFQYSDETWATSWKIFQKSNPENSLARLTKDEARDNVDAQISIMFNDLNRYQSVLKC